MALAWLRANEIPSGGIRVHSAHPDAYPEVSGYLIPTLLSYGEKDLAKRVIHWLLCIQRKDGSYTNPDGTPHVFDTGQILRGLLDGAQVVPGALAAAERAADYLTNEMSKGGTSGFGKRYLSNIPETVHLYVLPPLLRASKVFVKPEYAMVVNQCKEYYFDHSHFLQENTLTHFLGYELEALIDLGHADLASPLLTKLADHLEKDASLDQTDGKSWICAPGLAQLAICWYKTGRWKAADKALAHLELHQNPSGGFFGSYGKGAPYFPKFEISWAVKYYLDAHLMRIISYFERNARNLPSSVPREDGRLQAILSIVKPADRVLEVGCGKGRFLKAIHEEHPTTCCTGVDISQALLEHVPEGIRAVPGSLEQIPLPEDSFDVVFSVEAVEHSANIGAAISELIRVARPGGWILVIDKHLSQWGRLPCPPWERWPKICHLETLLNRGCDRVIAEPVGYDRADASDNLMLLWRGRKRSRLSGQQWTEVLFSPSIRSDLLRRVKHNHLSEWGQTILLATLPKEKVLEIGSGTGEVSLQLAQAGRKAIAMDFSKESLQFIKNCAQDLGFFVETIMADVTQPLPFHNDSFDCVWSSGLLEHFSPEQRIIMLREQVRISRKLIICIVPNAASVAYRAGKAYQEENGQWPYGLETPILSMYKEFEAAGISIQDEFSVSPKHALLFLPHDHPLKDALSRWIGETASETLKNCQQGYLLVSIGRKAGGI